MAIITQLTCILIISMSFAITSGTMANINNSSGASGSTKQDSNVLYGKFVPISGNKMHEPAQNKVKSNNENGAKTLTVSGGKTNYSVKFNY